MILVSSFLRSCGSLAGLAMEADSSLALLGKLEQAVEEEQPQKVKAEVKSDLLRALYRQMDLRKTGHISKQDLASMLRKIDPTITTARVTAMLKKISTDGDELVSFEESLGLREEAVKTPQLIHLYI